MEKWRLIVDRCKGCGLCVEFCPKDCLAMSESLNRIGYHPVVLLKPDECTSCAMCAQMCPETAISIYRRVKVKNA
ncbi:MAG: ferredoxin family protein [Phycisphaerae bacterium]|nr:ferredoxin family protein [Phycisphaerae bacterium]